MKCGDRFLVEMEVDSIVTNKDGEGFYAKPVGADRWRSTCLILPTEVLKENKEEVLSK